MQVLDVVDCGREIVRDGSVVFVLETLELPRQVCLLFGQEGPGLSDEARARCDGTFSIVQFGSTRSINASAAAAIAMHTWVRQHARVEDAWRGGPGGQVGGQATL